MMRVPPRRTNAAVALLLVPFVGVACGGSSGGGAAAKTNAVNVVDNKFEPTTASVAVGESSSNV